MAVDVPVTLSDVYEIARRLGHNPGVAPSYPHEVHYDAWCNSCDALVREIAPGYFVGTLLGFSCFARKG